jgi:hypothetical protein
MKCQIPRNLQVEKAFLTVPADRKKFFGEHIQLKKSFVYKKKNVQ